jgi:hypothetical protein
MLGLRDFPHGDFFLNRSYFRASSFRATEKLSGEYRDFLYTPWNHLLWRNWCDGPVTGEHVGRVHGNARDYKTSWGWGMGGWWPTLGKEAGVKPWPDLQLHCRALGRFQHWNDTVRFSFSFFFFVVLGLNSGLSPQLSHSASPIFVKGFFEIGFLELFAQAGFKPWSSWSLPP